MGYDRRDARTVYRLPFEAYPGLEVRVLAPSFGGELMAARVQRVEQRDLPRAVWLAELNLLLAEFADALESWTLTEGGRRVPCTHAELLRLDCPFLLDLLRAWAFTMRAEATPATPFEAAAEVEEEEAVPPEVALGLADLPHMPPLPDPAEPVDVPAYEPVLAAAG